MGGWEKLMEELKKRLEEQEKDMKVDRSGLEQLEPLHTVLKDTILRALELVKRTIEILKL